MSFNHSEDKQGHFTKTVFLSNTLKPWDTVARGVNLNPKLKQKSSFNLKKLLTSKVSDGTTLQNLKVMFNQHQTSQIGGHNIRSISNDLSKTRKFLQPLSNRHESSNLDMAYRTLDMNSKLMCKIRSNLELRPKNNTSRYFGNESHNEHHKGSTLNLKRVQELENLFKPNTESIVNLKAHTFTLYEVDLTNCQDSNVTIGRLKRHR